MNKNTKDSLKYIFFIEKIIPLILLILFFTNFVKTKSKNKEEIYLYNIGDSKYVQYDKKKHKFILSHIGSPFNLISDKWGNIALTNDGKFLHSKVFDRNLTNSTRSIFHEINQKFTLSYSGNSMYKLRVKHYCVSSRNKILYEDFCKDFKTMKNQYFYIVPKPFYKQHINMQNNLFKGYNNDIGQCMQMAAIRSQHAAMNMNENCNGFNPGNIGNYIGNGGMGIEGSYVNMSNKLSNPLGLGGYSDSSNYKYSHSNSGNEMEIIKKTLKQLCETMNKNNNSNSSNYRNGNNLRNKKPYLNSNNNYDDILKGIAQLQQMMSNSPSGCLGNGMNNPLNTGWSKDNMNDLNKNCIPAYNNDMFMKGNFNNNYSNNIPNAQSMIPNNFPQNSNSMNGMMTQPQVQPFQNSNYSSNNINTGLSNFPNSINNFMGSLGNNQSLSNIPNYNMCNSGNINGPLNLLTDPSCIPSGNNSVGGSNNGYGNNSSCIPSGNNSVGSNNGYGNNSVGGGNNGYGNNSSCIGSTMTPVYGANVYPSGQIPMNSPSTMGLGNSNVSYTNVC